MATTDVCGYGSASNDKLTAGCWADHEDGSLILLKGLTENDICIFEIYDLSDEDHPVVYSNALTLSDFQTTFSWNPKKKSSGKNLKWNWHDKTLFPWSLVMKSVKNPQPSLVNVEDTLSAAQRLKQSLDARMVGTPVTEDFVHRAQGTQVRTGSGSPAKTIMTRLKNAISELVG